MNFESNPLYNLKSKKKLSRILSINPKELKDIETSFQAFQFQKLVGKKERDLYNQDKRYKKLLRKLNHLLQLENYPSYVFGGMRGKDHKKHTLYHLKEENDLYVCKIDIKDFFPSTQDSYVFGFFKNKLKMSPDVSKILTLLTTQPSNKQNTRHLPQGFPTSTILSYLSYFDMFNGIYTLSNKFRIKFSLFVDDMVFSSQKPIPKNFIKQIMKIIVDYKLTVHPDKIKYYNIDDHKKITGIIITKNKQIKSSNSLQKEMYKSFRMLQRYPIEAPTNKQIHEDVKKLILGLKGRIHAIKYVESNRQFPHIKKVIKTYEKNYL